MKNQTIEQVVEEVCDFDFEVKLWTDKGFNEFKKVLNQALQAQRDAGAEEERERIEAQFPDYAHTRYLGCYQEGDKWYYGYDTEVVYLLADFLSLTPPTK